MSSSPLTPFSVETERRGDVLIVRVRGRVAEMEAVELQRELDARMGGEDRPNRVIVDLADADFISSSCLGVFLAVHKAGRKVGTSLAVAGPTPLVREVIATTRLNKLFPLYENVDEALAAE